MLKLNSELRAQAREALRGKWPMAAVAALIYSAIAGGLSAIPVIGGLCSLFVGRIFVTMLLQAVYTILWSLLLVIPGIIKSYSYAMTSFILKDEPEMKNNAAIEKSMAMMEGNKMKLFMLDLSFIGWAILCIFTLGIGLLFLQPYVAISRAAFYEDLKAQQGGSVEVNVEVNVEI